MRSSASVIPLGRSSGASRGSAAAAMSARSTSSQTTTESGIDGRPGCRRDVVERPIGILEPGDRAQQSIGDPARSDTPEAAGDQRTHTTQDRFVDDHHNDSRQRRGRRRNIVRPAQATGEDHQHAEHRRHHDDRDRRGHHASRHGAGAGPLARSSHDPILLHRRGDDHRADRPLPPPVCTLHETGTRPYRRSTARRGSRNQNVADVG